ncbi:MAG TPA: translation initiation factor [Saprospiraceae bacterium]|nr:translation initiation factor [Saprospiraceae bacterium]
MSKKNSDNKLVYSTDPGSTRNFFDDDENDTEQKTSENKQILRVTLDRKQRGGKEVTLVTGFKGSDTEIKELGSYLKSKCGGGGAVKDGEIIVQGNHVEKVIKLLIEKGFNNTKRSGG